MVLRIVLTVMPVCAHSCRKEAHRRHVSDDVTEKLKTWANDLCQSNVSVGDCVDVVHDFSKGRRIEAGAAFVKHIKYSSELGYALFTLQYVVGNSMIAVRGRWNRNMIAYSCK